MTTSDWWSRHSCLPAQADRNVCPTLSIPAAILVCIVLSFSSPLHAQDISLTDYRAGLEKVLSELEAGRLAEAQQAARSLERARVTGEGIAFNSDASILTPIKKATQLSDTDAQKARLKALLDALPNAAPSEHSDAAPDVDLLNRLRRDEAITRPPRDGQLDDAGIADSGFWMAVGHYLGDFIRWCGKIADKIGKFFDKLFPNGGPNIAGSIGPYINYIVIGGVSVAAGILLRAYLKNRRFKRVEAALDMVSAPAPSKDDNPLSRDANQWEEYALKLASSGRYREAIRAWFHAVLVMHFRSGALNYRKGRTNWEYCYALPSDLPWRDRFFDLTGSFETEWYGKSQSTPDRAASYGEAARQILSKDRAGRLA